MTKDIAELSICILTQHKKRRGSIKKRHRSERNFYVRKKHKFMPFFFFFTRCCCSSSSSSFYAIASISYFLKRCIKTYIHTYTKKSEWKARLNEEHENEIFSISKELRNKCRWNGRKRNALCTFFVLFSIMDRMI